MAIVLNSARQIEVEGLRFSVRPESYAGFLSACSRAEQMFPAPPPPDLPEEGKPAKEAPPDEAGIFRTMATVHFNLMDRIDAWEGVVLENGEPAPCTVEMKLRLFGIRPDLLRKISNQLAVVEGIEQKKSEPLQDG